MQIYLVGGAVRDTLLGKKPRENDYVVVGATAEEMLAQGFKQVGKDFPVFLHPKTQEEYALARTERKSGHGYHGFETNSSPDVTLPEDLSRRDLTINAIAQGADGTIIDPYGGQDDLKAQVLRHVSPAFVEDPLRILRVARFQAMLPTFNIAPETMALMQTICQRPKDIHALANERVWVEIDKASQWDGYAKFWLTLDACGYLNAMNLTPDIVALTNGVAHHKHTGVWRLVYGLWNQPEAFLNQLITLRPSADLSQCIKLILAHNERVCLAKDNDPETILSVLQSLDPYRRPDRANILVDSMAAISGDVMQFWRECIQAVTAIDTAAIVANSQQSEIQSAIYAARKAAITHLL